jgi:Flp pilus assembly pilin Flp
MLSILLTWLKMHVSSERGQDLIEYAMLGGMIALALVGVALVFNTALDSMAAGIGDCIDFKSGTTCTPF